MPLDEFALDIVNTSYASRSHCMIIPWPGTVWLSIFLYRLFTS